MALDLTIATLQPRLQQVNALWQAGDNPIARLREPEKLLRLGAAPPGGKAELHAREVSASVAITALRPFPQPVDVDVVHIPIWLIRPVAWDLRHANGKNFITPVKDQGGCGSCVAFGACATVEGTLQVQEKNPGLNPNLSEAQLFYCDAAAQGRNCQNGWWPDKALAVFKATGVADDACFPYTAGNQPCHRCADWASRTTKITNYHPITSANDMKQWLWKRGPLSACFTVYDDFFSYHSGVYHHVTGGVAGGHCVCIVGYSDVQHCWIAKNSWGTGWGDAGFFRIGYGQCGIDAQMWAVDHVTPPHH